MSNPYAKHAVTLIFHTPNPVIKHKAGFSTRTIQKRVVYWPTLLVHEPMQHAVKFWHYSLSLVSVYYC